MGGGKTNSSAETFPVIYADIAPKGGAWLPLKCGLYIMTSFQTVWKGDKRVTWILEKPQPGGQGQHQQ